MSDDRLIVALDVPNVVQGLDLAGKIGDAVNFYKIGLGMLTGGGLALANELKQEYGKRIFLDMKFFDIGATVEAAVRGIAQYDLDFLTVHGDPPGTSWPHHRAVQAPAGQAASHLHSGQLAPTGRASQPNSPARSIHRAGSPATGGTPRQIGAPGLRWIGQFQLHSRAKS